MLLSFIVDLKINEDDQVQILEFGPLQHAGFSGFKHVTGKDMREDIVYPFFEKAWHGPVAHLEKEAAGVLKHIESRTNQKPSDDEREGDTLLVKPYGYFVTGVDFYETRYVHGYEYMNGSASFMMLNQNKAYFDFMASEYGTDFPMPAHTSMVRRYSKDAVEDVLMNRVQADEYVIKTPDTAQGRGTMVVSRDDMDAVLKGICRKAERGSSPLPISSTWNHASPLITIQEKVKSRPTAHNGKSYDGTMRVAMTVWKDEAGELRHEIHGAYWKMPRNAIGQGDYQDQVISCSPHYDRLSDTFLKHSSPPETFASVSDQDMDLVCPQLSAHLPDFVAGVAKVDLQNELMPHLLNPVENHFMPFAERTWAKHGARFPGLAKCDPRSYTPSLAREDFMALAAMTYADLHYDGFIPSETSHYGLRIAFGNSAPNDDQNAFWLYKIPKPFLDQTTAANLLAHCREKPRGPVAAFLSSLHKRTLENNGYAHGNMRRLAKDVRDMRRPACSFAPIPKIIIKLEEFFCDVTEVPNDGPKI